MIHNVNILWNNQHTKPSWHLLPYKKCIFLWQGHFRLLSQRLSDMQYSIVNCGRHAVHASPWLFINRKLLFCCWVVWVVYAFWILTPYQIYESQLFLPLIGCLFIFLVVSIAVQKLFSLAQSHLFSFAFVAFAFGVRSKKIIIKTDVRDLTCLCFLLGVLQFQIFHSRR